jgi:Uma2 family endonuclease
MALERSNVRYSYADYLGWDEERRCELIDGVVFDMSPAPSTRHQDVLSELTAALRTRLRDTSCRAFVAPFDVRLFADNKQDDEVYHVVQPDLVIVCDKHKLDEKGCKGTPDLIIEVLSPSTAKKDRVMKFNLYERAGVKYYWIVDPLNETLEVYALKGTRFQIEGVYGKADQVAVSLIEDLTIDLEDVFREI